MDQLQKNGFIVVATDKADFALPTKPTMRIYTFGFVPEFAGTKRRAAGSDSPGISVLPTRSTLRCATASLCSADVARAR